MADQAQEMFSETDDNQTQVTEQTETAQDTSIETNYADLLGGITNEDGTQKYQDVETALTSLPHAQTHIHNIEADNVKLKEELAQALTAQELLRKTAADKQPAAASLSQDDLFKAIDSVLDAKSEQSTKNSNLNSVGKVFSDTYGEKAKEELKALAESNGVGMDFIRHMAETSPKAVLKLAGLSDTPVTRGSKTQSTVNTESFRMPATVVNKPVMGASNTAELVTGWRAAGETVRKNLA